MSPYACVISEPISTIPNRYTCTSCALVEYDDFDTVDTVGTVGMVDTVDTVDMVFASSYLL